MPLFFFAISGREVDDRPRHLTYPLSLKIEEKERIKEEMEPVRQFRGGTSASLPNYLSKNADVSIGVARSPLVKSANMAEVVSTPSPKAPWRAPRARIGGGRDVQMRWYRRPDRLGAEQHRANRGQESTGTGASNPCRPEKSPRCVRSRPRPTIARAKTWFCAG